MKTSITSAVFLLILFLSAASQVTFYDMASQLNVIGLETSRGVIVIDLNGDGLDEIYVSNKFSCDQLYLFQDSIYVDVANEYGVNLSEYHHSVCIADIDKDMRPDIYVTGDPPNPNLGRYYLNLGYPPFLDKSLQYNLRHNRDMGSSFFQMTNSAPLSGLIGGRLMVWQESTFIDVTQGSGLESMNNVNCPLFFDIDGDIDDDLFITGNHEDNTGRLFRNNGNGTFTDISSNTNQGGFPPDQGAAIADIDNDGDFDIYICSGFATNSLWRNNGAGYFTNITAQSHTGVAGYSRGACFGDFDNDGSIDLFVNRANDYNLLFHNDGTGVFTDISRHAGVIDYFNAMGCATGDLNNDGQLDIVSVNSDGPKQVYINQNNNNSFVKIKLMGLQRNSLALGANIKLYGISGDLSDTVFLGMREIQSLTAMYSVNDPVAHFGTGQYQNLMADVVFQSLNHIKVGDLIPGNTYYICEINTDIDENQEPLPRKYMTLTAYPNPFNNSVTISAISDANGMFNFTIYDLMGHQVKTSTIDLAKTDRPSCTWDGKNDLGQQCPSGVYIVKAKSNLSEAKIKITYIK